MLAEQKFPTLLFYAAPPLMHIQVLVYFSMKNSFGTLTENSLRLRLCKNR